MNSMMSAPAGTFVPNELFPMLGKITRNDADACDFGVLQLDDAGKVIFCNKYQSELAGIPASHYDGKNWFTQIAPCTNNGLVFGMFKKSVAAGSMNTVFPYTFTFKMKPTNVKIHFYRDQGSGRNFAFIARA